MWFRFILSSALALLVWYTEVGAAQPAASRIGASARAEAGGVLTRRLKSDVTTLNPVRVVTIGERYVVDYLFTPLVRLDRDLNPVAGLAKKWFVSRDGLIYRFLLDERATFSDKTPVRASDVVFTLRKAVEDSSIAPQIASSFQWLDVKRTREIDPRTVEVVFREPRSGQLLEFSRLFVIPEHVYGAGKFSEDFDNIAVGSGPYVLFRRDIGERIVLRRRDDYWGEKPYPNSIVFKVINDDTTAWNEITLGEIDETYISSDAWMHERLDPAVSKNVEFLRFYSFNYNFIAWNGTHPILRDRQVRRALAMCIPVDSIINDLYHGTARRLSGPFMPGSYAYNTKVPLMPYRPDEARKILRSLGWIDRDKDGRLDRDGRPLTFSMLIMSGDPTVARLAQTIEQELKRIGIVMTVSLAEEGSFFGLVRQGQYDAAALGLNLGPEPEPFGLFHSSRWPPHGLNIAFYANPEADRLIVQAQRELDRAKRQAVYWRLHAILAEDQPYTWTMQVQQKWAIRKRVHGVVANVGYGLFRWYPGEFSWWIARAQQRVRR